MIKLLLPLLAGLAVWVLADWLWPAKADFRRFDAAEVGRLDAAMWRSYYEKKPVKLFFQLARLLRTQFHAPFWRSHALAYRAAKAAFVFKNGKTRTDYAQALPDLERFYEGLNRLSQREFDTKFVAQRELAWWVIRRERDRHPPAEWEAILANEAAELYHLPADRFREHARLRVEAMLFRDRLDAHITDADWAKIDGLLRESWRAFHAAVQS